MTKPTSSEKSRASSTLRSSFTRESSSLDHLFVYGTLRRADPSGMNRLLAGDAEYAGEASFAGRLVSAGRFPAAIPAAGAERIAGELWAFRSRVSERLLARLDEYEGCGPGDPEPHGYCRLRAEVERADGVRVACWIYLHAGAAPLTPAAPADPRA